MEKFDCLGESLALVGGELSLTTGVARATPTIIKITAARRMMENM